MPARRTRATLSRTPPTTVVLVRHGRTPTTGRVLPGRAVDLHLSEEGRAQAERMAARLARLDPLPTAVYASPIERARETAAPIARALGVRVRTERGLVELDVGRWTGLGLKAAARKPEWAVVQRWPAGFRFPGGESFAELTSRATDAVLRIVAAHPGETVVAVSHADTIKAAVAAAAGIPLDLFQRLTISTCSASALRYHPFGPVVLYVNASADGLAA